MNWALSGPCHPELNSNVDLESGGTRDPFKNDFMALVTDEGMGQV